MSYKGQYISCAQYGSLLLTQTPQFDKKILSDIRPVNSGLMGFYRSSSYDAFTSSSHTFDRFNSVHPDTTREWSAVGETSCAGRPGDPEENLIGWGSERSTYGPESQSWATDILCWDEMMLKTEAKQHTQQIIDKVLRPATQWIMSSYLARKAAELAGRKWVANATMSTFTFTWDPGGYVYMTPSAEPTSMLTPQMLRYQVKRHWANGAVTQGKDGFQKLQLHTDMDTFWNLAKDDPYLKTLWRFGEFDAANQMYWKYGFQGYVGDFLVKCLDFPIRFNKVTSSRFQQVLPYKNVASTTGIKSVFNDDYDKAQYQWSLINHPEAIEIQPFRGASIHPDMPFLVRDFGGKWNFAMDNLGADRQGKAIDNTRRNKGKFFADFRVATKPVRPEFMDLIFHMVDKPAITIDLVSNTYPGYPAQSYVMNNDACACDSSITLTAVQNQFGQYVVLANSIQVNGSPITHTAIASATLANLVTALHNAWSAATLHGTWSVVDNTARTIKVTWTGQQVPQSTVTIPFVA